MSPLEVDAAIGKMKQGKSAGPLWMTDVCNAVVRDDKIPEDWSRSWMVNVYR